MMQLKYYFNKESLITTHLDSFSGLSNSGPPLLLLEKNNTDSSNLSSVLHSILPLQFNFYICKHRYFFANQYKV